MKALTLGGSSCLLLHRVEVLVAARDVRDVRPIKILLVLNFPAANSNIHRQTFRYVQFSHRPKPDQGPFSHKTWE